MDIFTLVKFANIYLQAASGEKPKLYFLIGPPAVGKSSWIKANSQGSVVLNRDEDVEKVAAESGIGTYDDMFERPPDDLLSSSGLTVPDKEIIKAAGEGDQEAKAEVDKFIEDLKVVAAKYRASADPVKLEKYGDIVPFDFAQLKQLVVDWGVPTNGIVPFEFSKVKTADETVDNMFAEKRSGAASQRQSMVLDMTSMNKSSRNSHRSHIVKAICGETDPAKVNEYYDQIAIVFAPKEGYSPELRKKIKESGRVRAEEYKAIGKSKTIPDHVYDSMFESYEPPTPEEGFSRIEYVGMPSLERLTPKA